MPIILDTKDLDKEVKRIKSFFNETRFKVLSIAAIEQLAKVPKNTLLNTLKIERRLPQKHIYKIVQILEEFGYEPVFDWSWIESEHSSNDPVHYYSIEKDGKKKLIEALTPEECREIHEKKYPGWAFVKEW